MHPRAYILSIKVLDPNEASDKIKFISGTRVITKGIHVISSYNPHFNRCSAFDMAYWPLRRSGGPAVGSSSRNLLLIKRKRYLLFPLAFFFTLPCTLHHFHLSRCGESANPLHNHIKKTNRDIDVFSCVEVTLFTWCWYSVPHLLVDSISVIPSIFYYTLQLSL